MAHSRLIWTCGAVIGAVILLGGTSHAGTIWNEAIEGDLSGAFSNPTPLSLSPGVNSLFATTGDIDPNPPYNPSVDVEYVRIDLPSGLALTNLFLQSYQGEDGLAWIGVHEGTTFGFHRDDVYEHIDEMLGGSHVGPGNGHVNGTDLLPILGTQSYGAQGYTPPLTGPSYTFWIQQEGSKMSYQLDFIAVPEPATLGTIGLALIVVLLVRRCWRKTGGIAVAAIMLWTLPQSGIANGIRTVARDASIIPPPITRSDPTTVQIASTIEEVTAEFTGGTTYNFWTFDGTVPGPLFRVMQGDTVELTLTNPTSSMHVHNIDLHAVNGPHGGAMETMVAPGESKTFTFTPLQTGAYIYHCAVSPPWFHIAQGMYGGIVVEPPGGLPPVDREFYVVQGDFYASAANASGLRQFDVTKALAEQPTHYFLNGHAKALKDLYPLEAQVGETIRIFFGVGGPNEGSNFHIIGEIFDRVYTGSPNTFVENEETWYVPPGSLAIFELTLNQPGDYLLVDHALTRIEKGALGILRVSPAEIPEPTTALLATCAFTGVALVWRRPRCAARASHTLCDSARFRQRFSRQSRRQREVERASADHKRS